MPNHVTNTLTVSGRESDLKEFHKLIESSTEGLIRAFLPFPEELGGEYIKTGSGEVIGRAFTADGYTWCLDNWGTKWGDYDLDICSEPWGYPADDQWAATYRYTTAWSPASEAILTISTMQPDILFSVTWEEEGNQSAGCLVCKNGYFAIEHAADEDRPIWPAGNETYETEQKYYEEWESMIDNLETAAWQKFHEMKVN
jgi:hypothetical protein